MLEIKVIFTNDGTLQSSVIPNIVQGDDASSKFVVKFYKDSSNTEFYDLTNYVVDIIYKRPDLTVSPALVTSIDADKYTKYLKITKWMTDVSGTATATIRLKELVNGSYITKVTGLVSLPIQASNVPTGSTITNEQYESLQQAIANEEKARVQADRDIGDGLTTHINNKNNPHEVTADQIPYGQTPGSNVKSFLDSMYADFLDYLANYNEFVSEVHTNYATNLYVDASDQATYNALKSYVDTAIASGSKIGFDIVDTLPVDNIQPNIIYLVKNVHSSATNNYDEYIYVNNRWEIVGSTSIDTSGFATKEEFEKAVKEIATDIQMIDGKLYLIHDGQVISGQTGLNFKTINGEQINGVGDIHTLYTIEVDPTETSGFLEETVINRLKTGNASAIKRAGIFMYPVKASDEDKLYRSIVDGMNKDILITYETKKWEYSESSAGVAYTSGNGIKIVDNVISLDVNDANERSY